MSEDPYKFDATIDGLGYDFKVRHDYDLFPPRFAEDWYSYGTDSGQSKPHLLDHYDDDGTAVFACGVRVEPDRTCEVSIIDPDGNPLRTALARLVPSTKLHARAVADDGKTYGCGLCVYEARKLEKALRDKEATEWGLRYLRTSGLGIQAQAYISGITT